MKFNWFLLLVFISLTACNTENGVKYQYADSPAAIETGKNLFEKNCIACHGFNGDAIGPDLSGVTQEMSPEWLKNFIKNPTAIIESGDPRAKALQEKYKTYMMAFPGLSDDELNAILAYMNTYSKKTEAEAPIAGISDPVPGNVPHSGMNLVLEEILTVPASAEKPPLARINKMDFIPNSSRLFISDLNGKLYELSGKKVELALDIQALMPHFIREPGLGTGFGSFAFHPAFLENGLLYTSHTEDLEQTTPATFPIPENVPAKLRWVITEWTIPDIRTIPFKGTPRTILSVDMYSHIHGMQDLEFNREAEKGSEDYGLLYVCIGDGGAAQDGYSLLLQDIGKIWGSIMRIDPSGKNGKNGQYGYPATNPFANDDKAETLGEIYAYGFRNPHRLTWDKGRLFASGIGQHHIEELNMIQSGANYGWPKREGTFAIIKFSKADQLVALPPDDSINHFMYPVLQIDHDEIAAISGGYVYRGKQIPALTGKYIFGGIVNGKVYFTDADELKPGHLSTYSEMGIIGPKGDQTNFAALTSNKRVDLRFGRDHKGELYIFTKADGKIYKVTGIQRNPT